MLLLVVAAAMLLPAAADWVVDHPDWHAFVMSAAVTAFAGGALMLANRTPTITLDRKRNFLLTALSWIMLSLTALPLTLSEYRLPWADAYSRLAG
jgi:trk system potassium uptake protein TrkH